MEWGQEWVWRLHNLIKAQHLILQISAVDNQLMLIYAGILLLAHVVCHVSEGLRGSYAHWLMTESP